jgi:hypothetical protein
MNIEQLGDKCSFHDTGTQLSNKKTLNPHEKKIVTQEEMLQGVKKPNSPVSMSNSKFHGTIDKKEIEEKASEFLMNLPQQVKGEKGKEKELEEPKSPSKPREFKKFNVLIREKALERSLRLIDLEQELVNTKKRAFELKRLRGSQNPVAWLQDTHFIPRDRVKKIKLLPYEAKDVESEKSKIINYIRKKYIKTEEMSAVFNKFLESANNLEGSQNATPYEKLTLFLRVLNEKILAMRGRKENEKIPYLELKIKLRRIQGYINQNVKIRYQKDEVISKLRLLSIYIDARAPIKINSETDISFNNQIFKNLKPKHLHGILKALETGLPFISKRDLVNLLNRKDFPEELYSLTLKDLTEYVSSHELLINNSNSFSLATQLEIAAEESIPNFAYAEKAGFVVKTGEENLRELLAQSLLTSLDLDQYVLTKVPTCLPQVMLDGKMDPKGMISGKWLDKAIPLSKLELSLYIHLHYSLKCLTEILLFLNNCSTKIELNEKLDVAEIDQLKIMNVNVNHNLSKNLGLVISDTRMKIMEIKIEITKQEKEIMGFLGVKDREALQYFDEIVREYALMDLVFTSVDSHQDQYLFFKGIPYCVDFARFLPLSPVYLADNNEVRVCFRSFFLDHPACSQPMSSAMKDKIKSWNIEELEVLYRNQNLIGDISEFNKYSEELAWIKTKLMEIKAFTKQLDESKGSEICLEISQKYEFTLKGSLNDQIFQVEEKLYKRIDGIHLINFPYVHPQAFEDFKKRLYELQNYITKIAEPTLQEAFGILYPDIDLFKRVLNHWEIQPALKIGMKKNESGKFVLESLENIIAEAQRRGLEELIPEMKLALERLRSKAVPFIQLALSMTLYEELN